MIWLLGDARSEPLIERGGQHTVDAFWAIWKRLGMPEHLQVDNEMLFYGSPSHPRGMGILIRLCLHNGMNPGLSQKVSHGAIEKFNDHYRQKFLGLIRMTGETKLREQSLLFEQKHNGRYQLQ